MIKKLFLQPRQGFEAAILKTKNSAFAEFEYV